MEKGKNISFGAVVTVLSLILIYLSTVLPSRVFLLSLSSFLISVLVLDIGVSVAMLSFVSTSLLGLLLIPNKLVLVPYIAFLGYYGIVKHYIEGLENLVLEWIIKLVVFNFSLYMSYIFVIKLFGIDLTLPISKVLVVLIMQALFIIYDYVFSLFISYYIKRFRKYLFR